MDYSNRLKWIAETPHIEPTGFNRINSVERNTEPITTPADTLVDLPLKHVSLFRPEHYEAGYAYPLIIWLHPDGGSEHDLHEVMPQISLRNYLGLSFRAPAINPAAPQNGYCWPDSHLFIKLFASQIQQTVQELQKVLNIHEDRIYLAGKGTGCSIATRLLLQADHFFAGAALIAGQFSKNDFGASESTRLNGKRILLDPEHAPHPLSTQRLMRLWKTSGAQVQLPGLPHDAQSDPQKLFQALNYWIMESISTAKLA